VAALGYLEVLDHRGHVAERVRIDHLPTHIGRAYTNHIVLDDPYVCPLHASVFVDEHGRLICRDRDSVNGLRNGTGNCRVENLELQSGTEFRLGRTVLRYRAADHPIAPTLVDNQPTPTRWTSPYIAVIAGLIVFLLSCLEAYLDSVERVTAAAIVSEPLITLSMLLTWAGFWSLAGRIIVSRFHFAPHVTIACGAILSFVALGVFAEWSEFFIPTVPSIWLAGLVGSGLILGALVYNHLGFSSLLRRSSRLWAALLVSVASVGFSVVLDLAARAKFSTVMEYTGVVKPIDAAWIPSVSLDQFIGDTEKLKKDLDSLAHKAKAAQP
jgi:hypothetical protein